MPRRALLLAATASALTMRRAPARRTVSMKWGEHIDGVKGDSTS